MKLSIITLTYNKLNFTKKYIESLYKYTKNFELIIVDNGSTDGTIEYLKTVPNIKLILNKENLGYSKGNNQGIEVATGEFIGFLNNDILLYPNWFKEIENIFAKESLAGFVSPRQINPHFENTNENSYIKYFQNKFKYKLEYEKNFDACEFACVITKREVLNKIGVFDENYTPAFFEDNDFKYRAIESGFGVYVANNVCFYHFGSITSKKLDKNLNKNRNYYYSKFPFAEYLSTSAEEKVVYKNIIYNFEKFPLNVCYGLHVFFRKFKNRIKKCLKDYNNENSI